MKYDVIRSYWPAPIYSDGSTLNLDFTTGVLDSRLTFTRASTATYINSSGYVTTMGAAPTNDPTKARFDYDPVTLAPRGLLIEAQAVNIVKYSNAFTSGDWYLGGTPATLTSNYAVGPDGVTGSAWRFQGALTNSVFATPVLNGGAAHVVSIYAKSNTGFNQTFTIYNGSSGTTCTATSVWQRFVVPVAGTWAYAYFGTLGTSQDILIWGAQSELGTSGASSYISTGASQVTRNADSCVMSDISSLSYSTTNGSMVYCGRFSKINSSSYPTRMGFTTSGGADTAFEIFTNATTIYSGIRSTAANNEITRTIAIDTDYKLATAFNVSAASQVRCSLNGAAAVGSSTSALTATRTPTVFGFTRIGYELYFPCGTIKAAKYYNTTLTDAELVSQST